MPSNGTFNIAKAITPSDTANIVPPPNYTLTESLYAGGAGVVAAVFQDDSVVNFTAVAGELIPIRIKRVNSTNTTATLLVALYTV